MSNEDHVRDVEAVIREFHIERLPGEDMSNELRLASIIVRLRQNLADEYERLLVEQVRDCADGHNLVLEPHAVARMREIERQLGIETLVPDQYLDSRARRALPTPTIRGTLSSHKVRGLVGEPNIQSVHLETDDRVWDEVYPKAEMSAFLRGVEAGASLIGGHLTDIDDATGPDLVAQP